MYRLGRVASVYKDVLDKKTGLPLFQSSTKNEWKNLLEHAAKGCISDHPDIPLYIRKASEKDDGARERTWC